MKRTLSYRGRGGKLQKRSRPGRRKDRYPSKMSRRRLGFFDTTLPVVGRVNYPGTVSFNTTQGLIGMGLGKVVPGFLAGILGRTLPNGEFITKIVVGGITGLALLSQKYRRNSYLVGFALVNLSEMVDPVIEGILNMVMPSNGMAGARRMGQLTPRQREALKRAEAALLSGGRMGYDPIGTRLGGVPDGGFVGRDVMLPSDWMALEKPAMLNGLNGNGSMVGEPALRGIA